MSTLRSRFAVGPPASKCSVGILPDVGEAHDLHGVHACDRRGDLGQVAAAGIGRDRDRRVARHVERVVAIEVWTLPLAVTVADPLRQMSAVSHSPVANAIGASAPSRMTRP